MNDVCYTLAFRHPQIDDVINVNYSTDGAFIFNEKDLQQIIVEHVYSCTDLGEVLKSETFYSRLQTLYDMLEGVICIVPHSISLYGNRPNRIIPVVIQVHRCKRQVDLKDELILIRFVLTEPMTTQVCSQITDLNQVIIVRRSERGTRESHWYFERLEVLKVEKMSCFDGKIRVFR